MSLNKIIFYKSFLYSFKNFDASDFKVKIKKIIKQKDVWYIVYLKTKLKKGTKLKVDFQLFHKKHEN